MSREELRRRFNSKMMVSQICFKGEAMIFTIKIVMSNWIAKGEPKKKKKAFQLKYPTNFLGSYVLMGNILDDLWSKNS